MKLLAVLAAVALAVPTLAQENECPGDYASIAAHGKALDIQPGVYAKTADRLDEFFATTKGQRSIYAEALAVDIKKGKAQLLLDIRAAKDFAAGHIPGAVNIELATLFLPKNLNALPTDGTPIVIICYTGHTASMAMGGLAALGYNAWVLRFGMMGWNKESMQKIGTSAPQLIKGYGGEVVK